MQRILAAAVAAVVVLSACGGAGAPTAASSPSPSAKPAFGTADTPLGKILVASNGSTLYIFKKDTDDTSTCYDACATTCPTE